jgi:hypothetical protein
MDMKPPEFDASAGGQKRSKADAKERKMFFVNDLEGSRLRARDVL